MKGGITYHEVCLKVEKKFTIQGEVDDQEMDTWSKANFFICIHCTLHTENERKRESPSYYFFPLFSFSHTLFFPFGRKKSKQGMKVMNWN